MGIDNIKPSFGKNDLPTKMVELFNESKSRFISILNQQKNELQRKKETLKRQLFFANYEKDIQDVENKLEKTRKIIEFLQNTEENTDSFSHEE